MNEGPDKLAFDYFKATNNYFWHWEEALEIAEWSDGTTICYREELLGILNNLKEQGLGLPLLGSVLLLLAGCNGWSTAQEKLLMDVFQGYGEFLDATLLTKRHESTITFLRQVAALNPELRTGAPKKLLFQEVFSTPTHQSIKPELAQAVIDEWASSRLDESLQVTKADSHWSRLTYDLGPFYLANQRFAEPGSLELLLRTGLDQLPPPLPTPEPPAAPGQPLSLFDQLTQDQRTAGLVNLAQHLVAALHVPMHTRGASDQPLGGVADITNRGNFDRLLLSELAHDDLSLTARLVNNEALYLRREEPPRPQARPRVILLDTTLRLWGTPRVFGLAAALAWAYHAQLPRTRAALTAYALGGQASTPLDLGSFEGVVQALSCLDPALHCGPALAALGLEQPQAAGTDYLLITEAEAAQQPALSQRLAAAQPGLRYLLTVSRAGSLELFEYHNSHRTLLSTSHYDLNELLAARRTRRPVPALPPLVGPAFLRCVPAPLYFPTPSLRLSAHNAMFHPRLGGLAITDSRRVLYWPDRSTGARELLSAIEAGSYYFGAYVTYFGTDTTTEAYVLVSAPGLLRVHCFSLREDSLELIDLADELEEGEQVLDVVFEDNCYYVRWSYGPPTHRWSGSTLVFDCAQRAVRERRTAAFPTAPKSKFRPDFGTFKRFINNGYSVFHRISHIGVNGAGELLVDGYALRLRSVPHPHTYQLQFSSRIDSDTNTSPRSRAAATDVAPDETGYPSLVRRFAWPDGSEAVVDTRGLLHLRSADASVPELTVLLIIGQPTAAWAADGMVAGSSYFVGPHLDQRLAPANFYQQYLQRFTAPLT